MRVPAGTLGLLGSFGFARAFPDIYAIGRTSRWPDPDV